eukprot:CAMPEP_0182490054 /NCGR_PEP_ID=MMETSP1321-20130603/34_1 /TAXON_ID=91990 /ORGANISM="Bolidomonas sp., Strain RCC1657" /LENGTH=1079 /DNA_ID=CAMNT_0024692183 /DNA_START=288 /DNA_END=3527 /DNA_ORIENTATION=+
MFDTSLSCATCGQVHPGFPSPLFKCPGAASSPEMDHVLMPTALSTEDLSGLKDLAAASPSPSSSSPFVKYRALLYPYRVAMSNGMSDENYVKVVTDLDESINKLSGTGFVPTPMLEGSLGEEKVFVKDESNQVAGSHKARHLFNVMTYLQVLDALRPDSAVPMKATRRLTVASCGNAGLAAATIAAAADWPIDVCIPDNADPAVVQNLKNLGSNVNIMICPRGVDAVDHSDFGPVSTAGAADPTVAVFKNLIQEHNSIPLSVQGTECGVAVEGAQTLIFELLDQAKSSGYDSLDFDQLFIQVGGGALGAGLFQGLQRAANGELDAIVPGLKMPKVPNFNTVQAEGNAPLNRAFAKMKADGKSAVEAAKTKNDYMFPWVNPASVAHGILDDETYDWAELCRGMDTSKGSAVVVNDEQIREANAFAKSNFKVNSCFTGSVGLAGLMSTRRGGTSSSAPSIVVLSGVDRSFSTSAAKPVNTGVTWSRNGISYRQLESSFDPDVLFEFNKKHGSTPHNFIPDEPVKKHFSKLATGETTVWGAFSESDELVGFISGETGGGYWLETGDGSASTCFINEFVVSPEHRGKRIGVNLTSMSVDPKAGIFAVDENIKEMYTTVHVGNVTSRTAFVKGGYREVMTYADAMRERDTTVLKFSKNSAIFPRGNSQTMRVVGVQSGNAVDGIDVGIFDFDPLVRNPSDPRALAQSLNYTTVANKTFPFTPEERNYVLGLRAMRLEDGNEYAEGNYKFGDWCAQRVNDLLDETGVDRSSVALIGSHGQTVSGHPHWEFGDLSVIAQKTGITVAGDFRPADVAAGGNGTPCTCTYDSIMLRPKAGEKKWRVTINIGGTSSVTFCPPWPTKGDAESEKMIPGGLDPGLGVFFMDLTVRAIDPSLEYDDDGKMARSGKVNEELLEEFLKNKYYQQSELPIGVGPDDFPETLWKEWHELAQSKGVSDIDLLTTFTELTAKQIAMACKRFGGEHIINGATDDVLLRGGVCNNSYFVERLKANFEEQLDTKIDRIKTLDDLGIDEDSWENAMYAMFGYLCYNNVYNFVPSCTGASRPVVGGRIAPGENFHSIRLTETPM